MSNENNSTQTIHEFDFNYICDYFTHVERQGPGSPEETLRALGFVDNLTEHSRIADLGCGTGGQTMVLGQNAPGEITGIDLFPQFIDLFNRQAERLGLQNRVKGVVGSMDALPFERESLDLIWSEGSIYNIGFERGLNEWRDYLKPGGYVVVSEASWFTPERPAEIHKFWVDAYPEIDTISRKVAQVEQAGYVPVATFMLPEKCWLDFYASQVAIREEFLKKHAGNEKAELFIGYQQEEMELYYKYKEFYGYVFYIGKKV